jgi:hypothetical protein
LQVAVVVVETQAEVAEQVDTAKQVHFQSARVLQ